MLGGEGGATEAYSEYAAERPRLSQRRRWGVFIGLQAAQEPFRCERDRPGVENDVVVREDEDAHHDEQDTSGPLHHRDERAIALEEAEERAERERREQERHAEPGGVGDQQSDAALNRLRRAGQRQDRAEDRSDAGRPADRERDAHRQRAEISGGLLANLQLSGPSQHTDPQHAGDVQPEDDDEGTADPTDEVAVVEEELAGGAERCAEAHEDQGKPEHEGQRVEHHPAAGGAREIRGEIADRHARDEGHVRREQREHARRQEREQPRAEGDDDADGTGHRAASRSMRDWAAALSQARGPTATAASRPSRSMTKLG